MRASSADDLRATFFFFNDTATTEIYTLSLHDALPISHRDSHSAAASYAAAADGGQAVEALPDADPRAARARGEKKSGIVCLRMELTRPARCAHAQKAASSSGFGSPMDSTGVQKLERPSHKTRTVKSGRGQVR